jgi:hypothetical protein
MAAYQLSRETLDTMESILRDRYLAHEISADEYASRMEDIRLVRRGRRS